MRVNKIWRRQVIVILIAVVAGAGIWASQTSQPETQTIKTSTQRDLFGDSNARAELGKLEVKGRAPKTGYMRKQFGNGWGKINGCSVREVILARDLTDEKIDEKCRVLSGVLNDPYTGQIIHFQRGEKSSSKVQIDHVVALSDAWQKGAQQLSAEEREKLANDPLNLLAVDGPANQAKGDGDAATWLPSNKPFRCQYVARQIAVKRRYRLWVTEAEKSAMSSILEKCVEVN
ncbi:HNH endonuclease family protein [Candidatus Nanosynbacter sp. TM7-074]|uniref:HNH endonuclease family protein n=1 Tax=Candidatus Nanosynbacter sp. TM7-074 TaxID=3158573 RepID=A0AB39J9U8_9BACT